MLYPDGQIFLFQSILDAIFDDYKPIYNDNYRQFAADYKTLEEGDNFCSGEPFYVHHFFAADLKKELDESPFQLLDSSEKGDTITCILQQRESG